MPFKLSEKLYYAVKSYIDTHYVSETIEDKHEVSGAGRLFTSVIPPSGNRCAPAFRNGSVDEEVLECTMVLGNLPETIYEASNDLDSLLDSLDAGFSESLLHLIDLTGKKIPKSIKKPMSDGSFFQRTETIRIIS